MVLVEPDGRRTRGAEAVFRVWAHGGRSWPLAAYRRWAAVRWACETGYRFVARHRDPASRLERLLFGALDAPPGHVRVRALFLRLLAVVYFIAFVSFWTQVDGLIGRRGILPAGETMEAARAQVGFLEFPTLCWISPSDGFLHALCAAGAALSVALFFDLAPTVCLGLLWVLYLSLATVGRKFMWFQWDALLLETGFLAILWAPPTLVPGRSRGSASSAVGLWLLRWLLFRLMFLSGYVKLSSGDESWWNLTALTTHYETQPLPTWIGWWAHQLPAGAHQFCCGVMFAIELGAPFLIFGPRRLRLLAFFALASLQLLIAATGNYGFFNLLTLALCATLLDDAMLPGRAKPASAPAFRWPAWLTAPLGAALFLLSLVPTANELGAPVEPDGWAGRLYRGVRPFEVANGYGLFRVMTRTRDELVVEGSRDGERWVAYGFRWKPGDPRRAPAFVEPHMPRLDWLMWFAALEEPRIPPWLGRFLERLQEGSPDVLALLAENPFPDSPPPHLRVVVYRYRFTDRAARQADGSWWRRERLRVAGRLYP